MERLDKVITSQTSYSRSDVKKLIKGKKVLVNNEVVLKSERKVNPETDQIMVDGNLIYYQKYVYLILNKPKGYVSAREDKQDKTVLDLVPEKYQQRNLFPMGRLDKDTTGLMIITDDGILAHEMLAPKKHVKKTYLVKIDQKITNDMIKGFSEGVKLNDGICQKAILIKISDDEGMVTLTEGRYHQIKRMFGCFNSKVIELKRIKMGNLTLPCDLKEGMIRELTKEEMFLLKDNG